MVHEKCAVLSDFVDEKLKLVNVLAHFRDRPLMTMKSCYLSKGILRGKSKLSAIQLQESHVEDVVEELETILSRAVAPESIEMREEKGVREFASFNLAIVNIVPDDKGISALRSHFASVEVLVEIEHDEVNLRK